MKLTSSFSSSIIPLSRFGSYDVSHSPPDHLLSLLSPSEGDPHPNLENPPYFNGAQDCHHSLRLSQRFQPTASILFSSDPVPSILHACQESRLEALPFYVAAFTNGLNPRYTWTNFHHDTINLYEQDFCKLSYLDKTCIRRLVIESGSADYFVGECRGEFEPMRNLAKLEITSPEFLYAWDQLIGWMRRSFTEWFAHIPGYVCPEIRIIQRGTQWELNVHNYEAIMRVRRAQTLGEEECDEPQAYGEREKVDGDWRRKLPASSFNMLAVLLEVSKRKVGLAVKSTKISIMQYISVIILSLANSSSWSTVVLRWRAR